MPTSYNIHVTSIKHNLNNFYQKLCATKAHLWSHYLMLVGWGNILFFLNQIIHPNDTNDPLFTYMFFISYAITIISVLIILFIIEEGCFPNFKITWKFIIANSIYHYFWLLGVIISIITCFCYILLPLYAPVINLFYK